MRGWLLTISLMASKASTSPILAAAHARGGVRASRMASSSYVCTAQSLHLRDECVQDISWLNTWKLRFQITYFHRNVLGLHNISSSYRYRSLTMHIAQYQYCERQQYCDVSWCIVLGNIPPISYRTKKMYVYKLATHRCVTFKNPGLFSKNVHL